MVDWIHIEFAGIAGMQGVELSRLLWVKADSNQYNNRQNKPEFYSNSNGILKPEAFAANAGNG